MSSATTLAPRACSSSAMARPMPLAAPVTMATLPSTSFTVVAMVVMIFLQFGIDFERPNP